MTSSYPPQPPQPLHPTAPPATPRRSCALPWVLVAVLTVVAVILGALLATRAGGTGAASQRFATPEEAIEFSTEQVADGDAAAALTAWAGDTQAENLDLVGTLERLRAFLPSDTTSLPSDDAFFVELAKTTRTGTAADQYRRLTLSLLLPEEVDLDTTTILEPGDVSAQDIADALDSSRLASLRAERIDRADGPENAADHFAEMAALVGADEAREYVVLYEWEGETYLGGVSVLRYGDEWSIAGLTATLAGTPFGTLEPTTTDDYEDLVAELTES